eukprot:4549643-Pyramimonas_sp.AAC.1
MQGGDAGDMTRGTMRSTPHEAPVALDASPRGGAEAAGAKCTSQSSPARRGVRPQWMRAEPDVAQGDAGATTW